MTNINSLAAVYAGLQNTVSSAGLVSSRLHPLEQPAVLLRETVPADAPYLLEVARSGGFRTLNFPSDPEGLARKIGRSRDSFRGLTADVSDQEMMFTVFAATLGGPRVPIGTSTFFPQHGAPKKPHHAYQVVPGTRIDAAGAVQDDSFLYLLQDHAGPSEVGGLIVHAGVSSRHDTAAALEFTVEGASHFIRRDPPYGRAASWVRFFWTALPERRAAYAGKSCLTEILPPLTETADGGRTNAFYEAHARKFFDGRPYDEMDELTNADRELITGRLPKIVRMADLPPEARALIGAARTESRPALKLLEKLGFKPTGQVDPIDAGPHFRGAFADNPLFTGARDWIYGGTSVRAEEIPGWHYGFIGIDSKGGEVAFRAALGAFLVMEDLLLTTPEIADFLELSVGSLQPVTAIAL